MSQQAVDTCAEPESLSIEQARQRMLNAIAPLSGFEQLAIRSALDRVLAVDVFSPIDVPAYANSAMDGYGVQFADLAAEQPLQVVGTAWAGRPFDGGIESGQAVRIMTGAMPPPGVDTVVMQEYARQEGEQVWIDPQGQRAGQHVRPAGEDMQAGECVLRAGKRLTAADIGLVASLGVPEVRVFRRPKVAFFSTGDELRSIGETLEVGQIYDSNRYTLYAMLKRAGVDVLDMGIIPDQAEAVETAFAAAAQCADFILTSGGVSVGEADYVAATLAKLGEVTFWKVAVKPGKPQAFGKIGQAYFFGLPGNPVSTMVGFYQFVWPALQKQMGQQVQLPIRLRVPTLTRLRKTAGRAEYQRGRTSYGEQGQLCVSSTGNQSSGILRSMSEADCFIFLPGDCQGAEPGELVEIELFAGMI